MRVPVSFDQAYLVVDTTSRQDSVMVILRAVDATPIFWSQERSDLESNLDAGGNPASGMLLLQTDPPLVLTGAKMIVWARSAAAPTKIECQVISQKISITAQGAQPLRFPGTTPPRRTAPTGSGVNLPDFETSWTRKGGVQ
jgi:hypothetical protein